MTREEWETSFIRCMGMLLDGKLMHEIDECGNELKKDVLLVLVNSFWEPIIFTLPYEGVHPQWELLVDTELDAIADTPVLVQDVYEIPARALVLLRNR